MVVNIWKILGLLLVRGGDGKISEIFSEKCILGNLNSAPISVDPTLCDSLSHKTSSTFRSSDLTRPEQESSHGLVIYYGDPVLDIPTYLGHT